MFKKLIFKLLTIPAFFYNWFYRTRIRVLAYHDVVDHGIFKKHIEFLNRNYNIIDLSTLKMHLLTGHPLPSKSLLISFDDGDYTVLENGLPAVQDQSVPACLFIITELIDTDKDFWFNNVRDIEKRKGKSAQEVNIVIRSLKEMTNRERKKKLFEYGDGYRKQLSLSDLDILKRNKVFIANHSHTHPIFKKCDKEELIEELNNSKQFFKSNDIEGYDVFAYPNGDFDNQSETVLKEKGIKLAFLFDHKLCEEEINPHRISRIRTNSDMSIDELKVKVSGLHSALQKIKVFK